MATKTATVKSKVDMKEAARQVLTRAKGPLHYQEITKRMLKDGSVKVLGKTPAQSMSSKLSTCAAKEDTFVRVAPGIYGLRGRDKPEE